MRNYPINFVVKHQTDPTFLRAARPEAVRNLWNRIDRNESTNRFVLFPDRLSLTFIRKAKKLSAVKTRSDLETVNENSSKSYGGAERDRTVDPLLAKQVLSQLSYSPTIAFSLQLLAVSLLS